MSLRFIAPHHTAPQPAPSLQSALAADFASLTREFGALEAQHVALVANEAHLLAELPKIEAAVFHGEHHAAPALVTFHGRQ